MDFAQHSRRFFVEKKNASLGPVTKNSSLLFSSCHLKLVISEKRTYFRNMSIIFKICDSRCSGPYIFLFIFMICQNVKIQLKYGCKYLYLGSRIDFLVMAIKLFSIQITVCSMRTFLQTRISNHILQNVSNYVLYVILKST